MKDLIMWLWKRFAKFVFFVLWFYVPQFFLHLIYSFSHNSVKGTTCHKKLANQYIFNSYNLQGVPFEKFFSSWSKAKLRFAVDLCQGEKIRERDAFISWETLYVYYPHMYAHSGLEENFFFHSIFRPDFYPHSISYSFVNPQNRLLLYTHKSWVHARPLFSDGAFPP